MSSTPSNRIVSSLYGPDSTLTPYSLDEQDNRKQLGREIPQLETHPERPQPRGSIYRSISWIFGFREKYSLINCFVWGGALVGYCLARSVTMNPHPARISIVLAPGEWFWFQLPLYKYNLFIHIYLTTIGGIFAPLQFLPAIRRRYVILHRLNGYGVLFCLIVGNICGSIIARRSFGGELNVQSAFYILGIMVVFSALMGIYNVKKDTRRHRRWMLRMVVYFSAIISGRLIWTAAAQIVTDIGTYFSIWRCDEVLNLLSDPQALQSTYPQCVAAGVNPAAVWVAVHASTRDGPLYYASALRAVNGMSLQSHLTKCGLVSCLSPLIILKKYRTDNIYLTSIY
ncbi:hypothetical protein DFH07DRAFT_158788 [Mycena maculata]|uniref:DUF2306 domain-containing protein n=1 Tax=Mycena maculata TaxID=230809 RepID=A0AAD7MU74_9AGAR|nr:hypothetical protein DFH07DRAFT_158788 [Mycena maculata]